MHSVYLMMHQKKPDVVALTKDVCVALHAAKLTVCAEPWLRERMQAEGQNCFDDESGTYDVVVAVGGDGTLLRANQTAISMKVPVLGVNVGHIGFLVESELASLQEACARLQDDDYFVEHRMMLDVRLPDGRTEVALNDVVISRGGNARLIAVKASIGGEKMGRYVADGLIVSTPTGSTGYSLSAGGPIVCPEVDCLILSPICAHSLQHRPVIAAASQTVTLTVDCDENQTAQLDVDGRRMTTLGDGEQVVIRRSAEAARLVRFGNHGFFQRVRDKLTEWSC